MKISEDKVLAIQNNLFYRSREIITEYNTFPWHNHHGIIDTDKVNASQAIAIDFWGCLNSSKYKNELINVYFDAVGDDWSIDLEYTKPELLFEPVSTQIDVLLKSTAKVIFIESKFTEKGGSCYQASKKKCNGNYKLQENPENGIINKCSLTGKKIKYWNYIDNITDFKKDLEYLPCPFKGMEYQWMRNICFAKAYSEKHNGIKYETYLFYYDSPKCHISKLVHNDNYLGSLKDKLKVTFKAKSYNDYISFCINYLKLKDTSEMNVWIELKEWMIEKERRLLK